MERSGSEKLRSELRRAREDCIPVKESDLSTRDGLVAALTNIVESPKSKPSDQIRAISALAEVQGFRARGRVDFSRMSQEELDAYFHEVIRPALEPCLIESTDDDRRRKKTASRLPKRGP